MRAVIAFLIGIYQSCSPATRTCEQRCAQMSACAPPGSSEWISADVAGSVSECKTMCRAAPGMGACMVRHGCRELIRRFAMNMDLVMECESEARH